jgi:hypothetical protein
MNSEGVKLALAAERLDETGEAEALYLVQSLETLHPFGKAGASTKTGA